MEDTLLITSKKMNKYPELINLLTKKPLNFNNNIISIDEIANNYKLIEQEINYHFDKIIKPIQNHTDNICIITSDNINSTFENVDGLITNLKGVALAISLADCQGILLYDPIKKVIGNIHSGWKGTFNKIIVKAINIMIDIYGSNPKDIIVYITPSIGKCCFEVDGELKNKFMINYHDIDNLISLGEIKDGKQKYYIDLLEINIKNLIDLGISRENIDVADICTKCNSNKFHSYRAEKEKSGRNISIICMK